MAKQFIRRLPSSRDETCTFKEVTSVAIALLGPHKLRLATITSDGRCFYCRLDYLIDEPDEDETPMTLTLEYEFSHSAALLSKFQALILDLTEKKLPITFTIDLRYLSKFQLRLRNQIYYPPLPPVVKSKASKKTPSKPNKSDDDDIPF